MVGLVLNEDSEYFTYPYAIFKYIADEVEQLNWKITNAECGGGTYYTFPWEETNEYYIDGKTLMEMLEEHPTIQWWWGILSGFPKSVDLETVKGNPIPDIHDEQPYLHGYVHHIEPKAVLEMVCFDSTETYVMVDDERTAGKLRAAFPRAESLDKYVMQEEE